MKKLLYIILLFPMSCLIAQTNWDNANNAYASGQYEEALEGYRSIAEEQGVSADLYYNTGNAYFKLNDMAHAIINYRRALKINSNHADALFNLEIARARTKDNMEIQEPFFLSQWTNKIISLTNSNTWLIISATMFFLGLLGILLFMFGGEIAWRKTGFYSALVFVLFFVITLCFSFSRYYNETSDTDAVIVAGSVTLKSSPDKSGTDLFVLHEGTEVTIEDQVGEWVYVRLANSDKAWMLISQLEKI